MTMVRREFCRHLFEYYFKKNYYEQKNKKHTLKKEVKAALKGNKVLFAALGGAAAGLTLAGIFGSAKGKEILSAVEDSISNTSERISNGIFRRSEAYKS